MYKWMGEGAVPIALKVKLSPGEGTQQPGATELGDVRAMQPAGASDSPETGLQTGPFPARPGV